MVIWQCFCRVWNLYHFFSHTQNYPVQGGKVTLDLKTVPFTWNFPFCYFSFPSFNIWSSFGYGCWFLLLPLIRYIIVAINHCHSVPFKVSFAFTLFIRFFGEKEKNSGNLQLEILKNGPIIKEWAIGGLSFGYQHKSPTVGNNMSKK